MRFKHLTVVGVGLIGGSFAKAARQLGLAEHITGLDNRQRLEEARSSGVIDDVEDSFLAGHWCAADLIYLAAPVSSIIAFLRTNSRLIRPGALITDAGSTKREICLAAEEFVPSSVAFVGGHPMAGSHNTGLVDTTGELFRDAAYAVVPTRNSSEESIGRVTEIATLLGARPLTLSAAEHDHSVALISHTPQLLSTALALTVSSGGDKERLTQLAGKGFSDCIRLAASEWSIWEDIFRTNPDEIDFALANVVREIELLRLSIKSGDFESLGDSFQAGTGFAQSFLKRNDAKER